MYVEVIYFDTKIIRKVQQIIDFGVVLLKQKLPTLVTVRLFQ